MKTIKIIFIAISLSYIFSCKSNNSRGILGINSTDTIRMNESLSLTDNELIRKKISLKYNFEIQADKGEDFGVFVTYLSFILSHNGKEIFIDTTLTEYQFDDKLYPIVNSLGNDIYEVIVEINDRPNKNYLKYFKIQNDSIIDQKELPTFITKPSDLDNDNEIEYAGYWDYSQLWGSNNDTVAYNPIIYYEQTSKGLTLDTLLTIKKNSEIYGEFMGFYFSESKAVSYSKTNNKFEKEIDCIKNK